MHFVGLYCIIILQCTAQKTSNLQTTCFRLAIFYSCKMNTKLTIERSAAG